MNMLDRTIRGTTLMELVLSSALLGTIALSVGAVYGVASRQMIQETNSVLSQNDSSFAMEHMKRHLMAATRLADPNNLALDYPIDRADNKDDNRPFTEAVNFFSDPDGSGPTQAGWQRYEVKEGELWYYPVWAEDSGRPHEVICVGVTRSTPFHRPLATEIQIVLQTVRGGGSSLWQSHLETTVNLRGVPING